MGVEWAELPEVEEPTAAVSRLDIIAIEEEAMDELDREEAGFLGREERRISKRKETEKKRKEETLTTKIRQDVEVNHKG